MKEKELEEVCLQKKLVFDGKILQVYCDDVRCPNGNQSTREVVRHCEASAILAFHQGEILLERQFRYPFQEVLYEIPAGKIDAGEDPLTCAQRELEEETGYRAKTMKYLGKIYPCVGYSDEVIHLFLANDLEKGKQHLDENELVLVEEFSLQEVLEMVKKGQIPDAKSICALQYYLLQEGEK